MVVEWVLNPPSVGNASERAKEPSCNPRLRNLPVSCFWIPASPARPVHILWKWHHLIGRCFAEGEVMRREPVPWSIAGPPNPAAPAFPGVSSR